MSDIKVINSGFDKCAVVYDNHILLHMKIIAMHSSNMINKIMSLMLRQCACGTLTHYCICLQEIKNMTNVDRH